MARCLLTIGLCLALALGLLALPARAQQAGETPEQTARRLLAEADSTTWFALNDAGDLVTFDRGLELLDEAETLIAALPDGPAKGELAASARALWADLRWQQEIFHDKLSAVFPLIRFYGTTLLLDGNALGSLELFDDPRDRAAEQALRGLLRVELVGQLTRAQLDSVFGASPPEPELESASLVFLNSLPGFFVHNGREVATVLQRLDPSGATTRALAEGRLPPAQRQAALAALAQAFGVGRLLYVTLTKQPAFDGEYFFIARAELLDLVAGEAPLDPVQVMGFGRDRTGLIWPLVLIQLLLWALAVLLHQRLRGGRFEAADLAPSSFGFAVGRIAPWLLLPVLSRVRPDDGMLMTVGFWWPAVAGAALMLVPILLLRLIGPRLPFLAPYLAWERGLESLALGIGCGLAAWLAVPLLALRELPGLASFLVAVPGLLGCCWLLARLTRGETRLWFAPFIALLLGLALATARLDWIAGGTALVLAGVLLARRAASADGAAATVAPAASYRPFAVLEALRQAALPLAESRVAWVALTGPAGSGKTSHVRALIAELAGQGEQPLLLLDGACQRLPDGSSVPFGPFQRCLAQHLKVDVGRLSGQQASDGLYNVLLGPLAPLFSGTGGLAASERDLFHFVTRALKQQAASARVVLLIDDAQWLDEASAGLLAHLQAALPAGAEGALLVLLAGRREGAEDCLAPLLPACNAVTLAPLTLDEQADLLRRGYGLAPAVTDWVLEWLGGRRGQAILPGQLAEVVEQLGRAQALLPQADGLGFSPGFDKARPPLAASAVAEVRQALERLPQTLDSLGLAAAFGRRFEAALVATALGQNRKAVLKDLEVLERETGLVRDVLEEDDVFEFRSQRALDAVREALSLRLKGPRASDVSQAVREIHAQAARALAERAQRGTAHDALADLLAQATHWYGAGRSHATSAVTANLAAARRLAALLRFAEARGFLAQAEECAGFVARDAEVAATRLWLDAEQAYVTGQGARPVALAGLEHLAAQPSAPADLVLVIARACYEAGRDGGGSLAGEAERLGLAVADSAAPPLERAQGLHLAGLALRFDPSRAAEGRQRLAAALALAEAEGVAGEPLLSQIANSLGIMEQAVGPSGYAAAEALFRRSLELKQRQAIPDRPGLARSYGGLGLLILEGGERARLQEAEDYLARDLQLAEELGDRNGCSKVRLWLGRCHLLQGESAAAEASYAAAVALAFSLADVTTAEAGLLEVAAAGRDRAGYLARVRGLAERFADQPVPRESRPELARALGWEAVAGEPAVAALRQRLAAAA